MSQSDYESVTNSSKPLSPTFPGSVKPRILWPLGRHHLQLSHFPNPWVSFRQSNEQWRGRTGIE